MTDQMAGDTLAESKDTTVVVQRSVSQPVKEVWRLLATPAGSEALLGAGGVLGDKGDSWHSADGSYGVVRSYHPLEQIRFSWHADDQAPKSLVDLQLVKQPDDSTVVEIHQIGLPDAEEQSGHRFGWSSALEKLDALSAPPEPRSAR